MPKPDLLILVKFKTSLSLEEVQAVAKSHLGEFRAFAGLQQKYYLQNTETGEYAGLYLWDAVEALDLESILQAGLFAAFETEGEASVEVFSVVQSLKEEVN